MTLQLLIVDDDALVLRAFTRLLSSRTVQVHPFSNAWDAKSWVESGGRPELVLCDYRLEGTAGPTGDLFLEWLRERHPTTTCVLFTADEMARRQTPNEHFAVLSKPIHPETLRRLVADAQARAGRMPPPW